MDALTAFSDLRVVIWQVLLKHEVGQGTPYDLLGLVTEYSPHPSIGKRGNGLRVDHPDSLIRRINDAAVLGFAFLEVAIRKEAGQPVRESPADFLEKFLFVSRPDPREGTLMQPEQVGLVALRVDRHGDHRLDAVMLDKIVRQRQIEAWAECDRTIRGASRRESLRSRRVHRYLASPCRTGIFRPGAFHDGIPRGRLGIARIDQERAVTVEDGKDRIEYVAHCLFEIIGALDRAVDLIEAFEDLEMGEPVLFRLLEFVARS
jgi:hypothetical protein